MKNLSYKDTRLKRTLQLGFFCVAFILAYVAWPNDWKTKSSNKCIKFTANPHGLKYKLVDPGIPFTIVILGLHESFNELGIDHDVVRDVDVDDTDSVYIVLTTHEDRPLPPRYISYNMEQLGVHRDDLDWMPRLLGRFRRAYEVWDYSSANAEYLRTHNIQAKVVPYGYSPFMTTNYTKAATFTSKTVDFLFVGLLNQRRNDKMKPILGLYPGDEAPRKTFVTQSTLGDDLDRAYARSKVALNIHYYDGNTVLEVHRILPMIANKVWVLSEKSDDAWYDR